MPNLQQLPQIAFANSTALIPVEQNGTTSAITVSALFAPVQQQLTITAGSLLGRASAGAGGPEVLTIGAGLGIEQGALVAVGPTYAPLDSPEFTGIPTAPTPPLNDNGSTLATTAFVQAHFLPATTVTLTGDVVGSGVTAGVVATILPAITTPGTYSKITINAKGQVISGTSVAATDISGLAAVAISGAYTDLHGIPASYQLPPATPTVLGGLKLGIGLSGAVDGTTMLASVLPSVDGSKLLLKSSISGALGRQLADIRGEVIYVADLLGARPTGQDATNAIVMAMGLAANLPGSTIDLCAGIWNFATLSASLRVPSRTTVRGAGRHQTKIIWNDTGSLVLFGSSGTSAVRATDIVFKDFMVTGTVTTNGAGSAFPFVLYYVDGLQFNNICSEYSRVMGITARNCTDIVAQGCIVRNCARDGINFAECAAVTIDSNVVENCDDDGIAVHSDIFDPWVVRKNIVISNNRLFGSQGIKVLSPRGTAIIGNIIDCCRTQGISLATATANGSNPEAMSAGMVAVIVGNVITNVISRANIDNLNQGSPGIVVTGQSARAGTIGVIPGEASSTTAAVVDPYPYFDANDSSANIATAGTYGIIIADNFIGRTLPACNGTVTAPKAYNHYSDYGFGQMFTRNGLINPQLAESDMRDSGILLVSGVIRDVMVSGNMIRGMTSGLTLGPAGRLENITFRGNQVVDCCNYGVLVNNNGTLRAYVEDNLFDLDPFFKSSNRGAHGSWLALGDPTGIKAQAGGVSVRRNIFRNLCRDSDMPSDAAISGWLFENNILEADPAVMGFSTSNRGVGYVRSAAGTMLAQNDSDPGSTTFGQVLTPPAIAAVAVPTIGKWLGGHWIRNSAPQTAGGLVNLGWVRLTTGSANVLGSDWVQSLAVAGSVGATLVLAGPTTGSAMPPQFRQLAATDVSGIVQAPAITNTYTASGAVAVTDNLALINASSSVSMTLGSGSSDGHVIVIKRFGAGAVTLTAAVDGIAGATILLSSPALLESISLAWARSLGTWLLI